MLISRGCTAPEKPREGKPCGQTWRRERRRARERERKTERKRLRLREWERLKQRARRRHRESVWRWKWITEKEMYRLPRFFYTIIRLHSKFAMTFITKHIIRYNWLWRLTGDLDWASDQAFYVSEHHVRRHWLYYYMLWKWPNEYTLVIRIAWCDALLCWAQEPAVWVWH